MDNYKYLEEVNEAVLRQIPSNKGIAEKTVLDIGCGTGALGEVIQKKGYTVWGIEMNEEAAGIASKRIPKVINADLTDIGTIRSEIGKKAFNFLIFADILEHLIDPLDILRKYLAFLKEGGCVLVSLPNTVAWLNRIMFLFGSFEYSDTGIMDRDHIRFFTFKTAKKLVRDAGCSIEEVDYIPYFARIAQPLIKKILLKGERVEGSDHRQLFNSPYYRWYMKYINPLEYILGYPFKSLFAFKMIIVGKR